MTSIHPLAPETAAGLPSSPDASVGLAEDVLGGKAHGLRTLAGLGLPVPPGFVITTAACRAFLRDGRFPDGLEAEMTAAVHDLETAARERFGASNRPLSVSVRSGAAVSMPGMMDTILDVDPADGLRAAVEAVFRSWRAPRAVSYREVHGIPHDLGTAVIVQAMVFGDRDERSGSGVAFSRDPSTGVRAPFGDVLFERRGDAVVSGQSATRPLSDLAAREPAIWTPLVDGLDRAERHYRDACHVEFTFESGKLWFLQVRPGGLSGRAAVRVAVDLVGEGLIDRATALARVTPRHLRAARTPRIRDVAEVIARGVGASPGVASGRIAVTADQAVRMAADGPVILVRPHTSPLDMHGLAAAAGIVTTVGGPTSHAAVVARSMGKPAVVATAALTVDPGGGRVHCGGRSFPAGTVISIDGTGGEVVPGTAEITTGDTDPHLDRLLGWAQELP
ncbi:PEP/pyruvate-binding domain-containing protein [Actinoplanes utahensis]|uniref:PEP/pyruvate-binding domain-containing protein n=1 Tax=Actinoplanes utahensis TaxID=1869 RepID=UPI0007C73F28|nr:PEP/pyruvate-binding domain-containing protein [Actinoplanes utahensis]GIF30622.1 hypothetical protein Aut01nite_36080 [Actinoplanes utahensis]